MHATRRTCHARTPPAHSRRDRKGRLEPETECVGKTRPISGDSFEDPAREGKQGGAREPRRQLPIILERPEAEDPGGGASIDSSLVADHDGLVDLLRDGEPRKQSSDLGGGQREKLQRNEGRLGFQPTAAGHAESAMAVVDHPEFLGHDVLNAFNNSRVGRRPTGVKPFFECVQNIS